MECVFCKIAGNRTAAFKVWENRQFLAFLDVYPLNPGHTLLIPKKHVDYIFDLEDDLYSGLFRHSKEIAGALKKATEARKIGIVVEGFEVRHAHVHLIPLHGGGELDPRRRKRASETELAEMQKRIKESLNL